MSALAYQITSVSIVCSTVCSGADQRQYQASASLAFVRGIHQWLVDSLHKGPVTQKMFPFYNDIMSHLLRKTYMYFGSHMLFNPVQCIPVEAIQLQSEM